MDKQFNFKNMEHSATLENYANQLLAKIEEFLKNETEPIYIRLCFDSEPIHHHHTVEFDLKSPHYDFHVCEEGPEMYKLVNEVMDIMYARLRKEKEKHVDAKKIGLKKRE